MYRLCGVNYIDFWWYTPAETSAMLDIANDNLKYDTVKHAQILLWLANGSHIQKHGQKFWDLEDFLPDFAKSAIKKELTPDEIESMWWNAAD